MSMLHPTEKKDRPLPATVRASEDEVSSFSALAGRATLNERQFKQLSAFIERELGIKMPVTKKIMLESRLQKRLRVLRVSSFEEYLELVFGPDGAQSEMLHMIDAVTTNKTDFFREPDHFRNLLGMILPERYGMDGWGGREPLRVWSTASSTGEEPYTLAMVLEEFRSHHSDFSYRILATDISTDVLERGRQAIYTEDRVEPVPPAYRQKYLLRSRNRSDGLIRVKPELRSRVTFQRVNLMSDDFGLREQFEVIFCRNVIIYFDRSNQIRLIRKLFDHLRPGGYLFLGHSETLAGVELPFRSVAPTIYRKPE